MKDFEKQTLRLYRLSLLGKAAYSVFLFFTLIGMVVTVILYHDMVGIRSERITSYYHGGQEVLGSAIPKENAANEGPQVELPSDLSLTSEQAMPLRKLLEVTHFHLFTMPVYLLILSHLFMMTGSSSLSKLVWMTSASMATLGHVIAPWFARSATPGHVWAYGLSGFWMLISYSFMALATLWAMWRKPEMR